MADNMVRMMERTAKAMKNITHASNWIVGGYENTLSDYCDSDPEYIEAECILSNHENLVEMIYEASIHEIYDVGYCDFSERAERELKDIRFLGKERLMAFVEMRVKAMGY